MKRSLGMGEIKIRVLIRSGSGTGANNGPQMAALRRTREHLNSGMRAVRVLVRVRVVLNSSNARKWVTV